MKSGHEVLDRIADVVLAYRADRKVRKAKAVKKLAPKKVMRKRQ